MTEDEIIEIEILLQDACQRGGETAGAIVAAAFAAVEAGEEATQDDHELVAVVFAGGEAGRATISSAFKTAPADRTPEQERIVAKAMTGPNQAVSAILKKSPATWSPSEKRLVKMRLEISEAEDLKLGTFPLKNINHPDVPATCTSHKCNSNAPHDAAGVRNIEKGTYVEVVLHLVRPRCTRQWQSKYKSKGANRACASDLNVRDPSLHNTPTITRQALREKFMTAQLKHHIDKVVLGEEELNLNFPKKTILRYLINHTNFTRETLRAKTDRERQEMIERRVEVRKNATRSLR